MNKTVKKAMEMDQFDNNLSDVERGGEIDISFCNTLINCRICA